MSDQTEKREWPRVSKRIKINAIVIDPQKKESLFDLDPVWTRDVGGNGLGLVTRVRCAVGAGIDVEFHLPRTDKPIKAKGRVVWSKLEDEAGHSYRVGVAFTEITEAERKAIRQYVEVEAKKVK